MNSFSQKVREVLGWYVYVLIDPRDNDIFYTGEGVNNRVFDHEIEANTSDKYSEKLNRIREIQNEDLNIKKVIIRHVLRDQKEAQNVESAVLEILRILGKNLTNIQSGHHQHDFKYKTVEEIEYLLGGETIEINSDDKILFLNISKSYNLDKIYIKY